MLKTKNERLMLFIGVLIGLLIATPMIFINPTVAPLNEYETIIVENKFEYNRLYQLYTGEIGSAIDGDIAIQIEFNVTSSAYRNVGVMLLGTEEISIYALCFYDNDDATIYIEEEPVINEWYDMTEVDSIKGVIVFCHRGSSSLLEVATWIW
jgi:hypothetical protein